VGDFFRNKALMARLKSRHKETPVFQIPVRSHSFSQNTKQLQRAFVPRCAGGGGKFPHSCGLVASKEDAGLKPSAYMQTRRDGESKKDAGLKPGATFKPTETQRAKKMLG